MFFLNICNYIITNSNLYIIIEISNWDKNVFSYLTKCSFPKIKKKVHLSKFKLIIEYFSNCPFYISFLNLIIYIYNLFSKTIFLRKKTVFS